MYSNLHIHVINAFRNTSGGFYKRRRAITSNGYPRVSSEEKGPEEFMMEGKGEIKARSERALKEEV